MSDTNCAERLIFVPYIGAFGGVERLILSLSRYMHQRSISHSVLCFDDTIGLASFADWPITVRALRPRRNAFTEIRALQRHMRRWDRPHRGSAPPALMFDLKGAFYAAFTNHDFVVHLTDPPSLLGRDVSKHAPSLHGQLRQFATCDPQRIRRLIRAEVAHRVTKRGVQRAATVIAMTDAISAEIKHRYDTSAHVVRPGVAIPVTQRHDRWPRGRSVRLLSVSRLEPSKRVDWIVQAVAELARSSPCDAQPTLDIVGSGSDEARLRNVAAGLQVSERITFHARVDETQLDQLYANADMFVMPAVQGWGLPALEALARGVPVVLHEQSGVAEILQDTCWVELIRDTAGRDVVSALDRLLQRILSGRLRQSQLPRIPTDTEWAETVCRVCGWV